MQIGKGKQGVIIGEYHEPQPLSHKRGESIAYDTNGIIGWVEPACDNANWILWFTRLGGALLYIGRGPKGTVLGDPIEIKAKDDTVHKSRRRYTHEQILLMFRQVGADKLEKWLEGIIDNDPHWDLKHTVG
jgi:hypothetical protein